RKPEAVPRQLLDEMQAISDKIRRRAHELFLMRGAEPGRELDDWLQAERELMWLPETQLVERSNEFQVRINVRGLEPKEIRLVALVNWIILEAEPKSRESKLFQRLDFSTPIDPAKVSAKLDKGILQVTAPKTRRDAATAAA